MVVCREGRERPCKMSARLTSFGWIAWWTKTICLLSFTPYVLAFQSNVAPLVSVQDDVAATRIPMRLPLVPVSEFTCMIDALRESEDNGLVRGPRIDFQGLLYPGQTEVGTLKPYVLGIAEEKDLRDICMFIVRCFGADAIRVSSSLSPLERAIIQPMVNLLNSLSKLLSVAELYQGLRIRTLPIQIRACQLDQPPGDVTSDPQERIQISSRSSVVIALAKVDSRHGCLLEVVAAVELRLEPCDAKIPFALPILDSLERKLASVLRVSLCDHENVSVQPYLSNLCVDERIRGRGVGRLLVRLVATIARHWGYSNVYLHVDEGNSDAYRLYTSEGYREVGRRWNPFWAGQAALVGYLRKTL